MKTLLTICLLGFVCIPEVQAQSGTWGSWRSFSNYEGLDYRVKYVRYNKYIDSGRNHVWQVEVRNRYNRSVSVSISVTASRNEEPGDWRRNTIRAGGSYTFPSMFSTAGRGEGIYVHWRSVDFKSY